MINLRIKDCLFHGIRLNSHQTTIDVLEDILKSKYILTYQSLRGKGIFHEREHLGHQGMNAISVCFHPNNKNLFLQFKDTCIPLTEEETGFNQFINTNNPSIILSPDILNKLSYRTFGGYKRLIDEIQILSDISLENMIAIGYGNTDIEHQQEKEYNLRKIKELLKKYNFDVPIINPLNGTIYEEKIIRK